MNKENLIPKQAAEKIDLTKFEAAFFHIWIWTNEYLNCRRDLFVWISGYLERAVTDFKLFTVDLGSVSTTLLQYIFCSIRDWN